MDNAQILPRYDLREPQCRKYEKLIAEACYKSLKVDPRSFARPLGTHTCALRLRDAILGFMRFNYSSDYIPKGFNLAVLKVHELTDGCVLIQNPVAEQGLLEEALLHARDQTKVRAWMEAQFKKPLNDVFIEHFIRYDTTEERDWMMAVAKEVGLTAEDRPATKQVSFF